MEQNQNEMANSYFGFELKMIDMRIDTVFSVKLYCADACLCFISLKHLPFYKNSITIHRILYHGCSRSSVHAVCP